MRSFPDDTSKPIVAPDTSSAQPHVADRASYECTCQLLIVRKRLVESPQVNHAGVSIFTLLLDDQMRHRVSLNDDLEILPTVSAKSVCSPEAISETENLHP